MDNDELLIAIKDMFEKTVSDVKNEIAGVKLHTGTLVEDLRGDIKAVAKGHDTLNRKIDNLRQELKQERTETKDELHGLKVEVNGLKKEMAIVKDYVIAVDAKLNEHEIILKRVK